MGGELRSQRPEAREEAGFGWTEIRETRRNRAMEDWLAFAQRRERLSFKWALASAVSGAINAMIVAVSYMRKTDWLQPSGIVASAAALILLISAVVFPLSFLAWLVWM